MIDLLKTDLQKIQEGSTEGTTSWVAPDTAYQSQVSTKPSVPNLIQDDRSAFMVAAGDAISTTKNFLLNQLSLNVNVDPNYNPFEDQQLKGKGLEYLAQYGQSFINSPNTYHTSQLIKRVDESNKNAELFAQNPAAAFAGSIGGSLLDPTNFLLIAGLPVRAGVALSTLARGVEGAGIAAAFTSAQKTYDPTITGEQIAMAGVFGAGLGAMAGLIGGVADTQASSSIKKWLTEGKVTQDKIDTDNLDSVGAARNLGDANNSYAAETNSVFKGLQKVAETYAPSEQMLGMSTPIMREFAQVFGGTNTITIGNLEGVATRDALQYTIEAARNSKLQPHEDAIDKAFMNYNTKGGKLSQTEFEQRSFLKAGGAVDDEIGTEASSAYRKYFDDYAQYNKDNGLLHQDAELEDDWLMHYTDHDKIVEKFDSFKELLFNKIYPRISENPIFYLDDATLKGLNERFGITDDSKSLLNELRNRDPDLLKELIQESAHDEVLKVADDIRNGNQTLYRSPVDSYTSKSLRERTLQLSNDEIAPYLRTDTRDVIRQYTKSIETTKAIRDSIKDFREAYGNPVTETNAMGDPYEEFSNLIKDQYKEKVKFADPETVKALDKEQIKATELIQTQLDLLTGNIYKQDKGMFSDSFRTFSSSVRWWNTMRMGGFFAIASLGDIGSSISNKIVNTLGLREYMSPIIDKMVLMSKNEKAILGAAIDNHLASSRNINYADLYGASEVGVKSKWQVFMDKSRDWFFNITLFNHITGLARSIALKEGINTNLKRIEKLLANKLDPHSYDGIELANFGYGVDNIKEAESVLNQFKKHRTEAESTGGKHYYSNIDKWDDKEASYGFTSKLLKYRNRMVVEPDNGTRPKFFYNSLGGIVGQFKGFMMSSFVKQLLRRAQTANLTTQHSQAVMASFVFQSMLGIMSGYLRDAISGRDIDVSPEKMAFYAFDRGGFFAMFDYANGLLDTHGFGLASALGVNQAKRFGQQGLISGALGPSFGALDQDLLKAIKGIGDGTVNPADLKKVMKLMPLYNLPYWAFITQNIDK